MFGWGVELIASPRLRECDSGALLVRLVYRKYVCELGQSVNLDVTLGAKAAAAAAAHASDPRIAFVRGLCAAAESLLQQFREAALATLAALRTDAGVPSSLADAAEVGPLLHGLLRSLRYCLLSLPASEMAAAPGWDAAAAAPWRGLYDAAGQLLSDAFSLCVRVISEDEDTRAAAAVAASGVGGDVLSKGRIDCRGHLITEAGDEDAEDDDHLLARCAWLIVKEVATGYGLLVSDVPMEPDDPGSERWVLARSFVRDFGHGMVAALLRMQHFGAVKHTGVALGVVSSRLLQLDSARTALRALPGGWLDSLLGQITTSEFILRRSAGYGLAIQVIVASEPHNVAPCLLQRAMSCLLAHAGATDGARDVVRARVHALNVMRLMFWDSQLARDVPPYVHRALEIAFLGFHAPMWAVRNSSMMLFTAVVTR